MIKIIGCLLISFFFMTLRAQRPVSVILDTDIGPDYDDVGALAVLHALANKGEAKILAIVASNRYEGIAGVINTINTYYGHLRIPIGVVDSLGLSITDRQHWTDTLLSHYQHSIKANAEAMVGYKLYRKILGSQPNQSVTIVTIGFLTNLQELLSSKADEFSPLSGIELVRKKVKRLISMAGGFPTGREYNLDRNPSTSKYVFDHWPTSVIFSGLEIGVQIHTGIPLIQNNQIQNSPVKDVYRISIPLAEEDKNGRMSWDQSAVLIAIKGWYPWFRLEKGQIIIDSDGSNTWIKNNGKQAYVVRIANKEVLETLINELMMYQPKNKNRRNNKLSNSSGN